MLIVGAALLVGFPLVWRAEPYASVGRLMALGFLMGTGVLAVSLILAEWVGIRLTPLTAAAWTLLATIGSGAIAWGARSDVRDRRDLAGPTPLIVASLLSGIVLIISAGAPRYFQDSIAYYRGKGLSIAYFGGIDPEAISLLGQGTYPPLIPLLHALGAVWGVSRPEAIYGCFYASLLVLVAEEVRIRKLALPAAPVLLLGLTPLVFLSGTSVMSNLPGAAFFTAGSLYVARYRDGHEIPAWVAGACFGFACLTRLELVFYLIVPALGVAFIAARKEDWSAAWSFLAGLACAYAPWWLWRIANNAVLSSHFEKEWALGTSRTSLNTLLVLSDIIAFGGILVSTIALLVLAGKRASWLRLRGLPEGTAPIAIAAVIIAALLSPAGSVMLNLMFDRNGYGIVWLAVATFVAIALIARQVGEGSFAMLVGGYVCVRLVLHSVAIDADLPTNRASSWGSASRELLYILPLSLLWVWSSSLVHRAIRTSRGLMVLTVSVVVLTSVASLTRDARFRHALRNGPMKNSESAIISSFPDAALLLDAGRLIGREEVLELPADEGEFARMFPGLALLHARALLPGKRIEAAPYGDTPEIRDRLRPSNASIRLGHAVRIESAACHRYRTYRVGQQLMLLPAC